MRMLKVQASGPPKRRTYETRRVKEGMSRHVRSAWRRELKDLREGEGMERKVRMAREGRRARA